MDEQKKKVFEIKRLLLKFKYTTFAREGTPDFLDFARFLQLND